jgi:hypothetical protein
MLVSSLLEFEKRAVPETQQYPELPRNVAKELGDHIRIAARNE